jgi:hypothetical protein
MNHEGGAANRLRCLTSGLPILPAVAFAEHAAAKPPRGMRPWLLHIRITVNGGLR